MTKPTTAKLSNTQHLVLASACAHPDAFATRPTHLKPAQAAKVLAALVEAGLVREVRAKLQAPVWRHDEQGRAVAVKILKAGRQAVAASQPVDTAGVNGASQPDGAASGAGASSASPAVGSKRTLIIALMRREGGATMDELTAATDWLPHTTRAALSGLRKSGIAVELAKVGRGAPSTYRVASAAGAAAQTIAAAA